MNRTIRLLLGAAAAIAVVGCNSPPLVDRTQPNYIKKSDLLDGQWYFKETVVDVPPTSPAATIGQGGGLEKIRWEIQEDLLVGYRTYEPNPGRDPQIDLEKSSIGDVRLKNGKPYKGSPVVAYKILSHFDRQRQYNAATGEQVNVLVEDERDRPWYQREYMRVQWGVSTLQNSDQCLNPPGKTSFECLGRVKGLAVRYVTDSDSDPHNEAMVMERNAEGTLTYFDFTTQAIADPVSVYFEGYGNVPYCYFDQTVDCDSVNIKVRTSIRRVDEERVKDYEPLKYTDKMMVKFGFFRQEMYSYDRGYTFTDSGRIQYAMRHNIWQRAHDEKGNTLPVTQRALRPVVYYVTDNFPKELLPAANGEKDSLQASYDSAFRRAVAVPRGLNNADVPQMFYVCESPVKEGAPEACGKPGTYPRLGDIRYNLISYVEQITGGLLGLGPSAMDPETGEVVQAVANIYGPGLDSWTGASTQVIDVLNGDLTLAQLTTGKDIRDYVQLHLNATDPRRPLNGPWAASNQQPLSSPETRNQPMGSLYRPAGALRTKIESMALKGGLPKLTQDRKAVVAELLKQNPALDIELADQPEVRNAMMARYRNPGLRRRLETDPSFYRDLARQTLMGQDPFALELKRRQAESSPEVGCNYGLGYDDPDYIGTAKSMLKLQQSKQQGYQQSGHPTCANTAQCSAAEAKTLAKKDVWDELRRQGWRSIAEHEVGHTVGLRHNFVGSFDSLNFADGYWDLRKQTIGVTVGGKRVLPITPQNMIDGSKQNQEQLDKGMYEYQYSSIMDYGARVNAQNKGLGKYDNAAILFAYAGGFEPGYVEVFNELRNDYDVPNMAIPTDNLGKTMLVRNARLEIPLQQVEHYTGVSPYFLDKFHYTTAPFTFAEKNLSFEEALEQGVKRINDRSYRKWSEMEGWYAKIADEVKNYTLSQKGFRENDWERSRTIIGKVGRGMPVEVPYMFCTDEEVGANMMCNRHDQGADPFEMSNKWMERFENTYVFSNFRRDRLIFDPNAVYQGKFARYLGNIPNVYQQWLFNVYYTQRYYGYTAEQMDELFGLGDPIWQNYWTMSVIDSTNLLMQQLSTPSAGYHGKDPATNQWVHLPSNRSDNTRLDTASEPAYILAEKQKGFSDVVYVPRGPGRSMYTQYAQTGDLFFTKPDEIGHFWDVIGALSALTTSETNFLGVDRGSDALRYSLPYYLTFNKELAPLFGSVWTDDRSYYASSLIPNGDGTATILPPVFVRGENYITGFDYPPQPVAPVDNSGQQMRLERVQATPTWTTKFYTEFWGMAFFTDNFNQEFATFNQVYRLGSGESVSPAAGFEVVSVDDPLGGGYTYAALRKVGDTNPPAAPRMVVGLQATIAKYEASLGADHVIGTSDDQVIDGKSAAEWAGAVRDGIRSLELMRGFYGIFGRAL